MRKIVLRGSAKTVGTDFAFLEEFEDDVTDTELDRAAWEASIENAQTYGWDYVTDDYYIPEDEEDYYITDAELNYYWEEYEPEVHDGLLE